MESVIDAIDSAFEKTDVLPVPEVRPGDERQLLAASQHLMHQARTIDQSKRAEDAQRLAKQSTKQVLPTTATVMMDGDSCETFVVDEMRHRVGQSRWSKLDVCFKWQKIREYLEGADVSDSARTAILVAIPGMLRAGTLGNVEYDSERRSVTRLNHSGI